MDYKLDYKLYSILSGYFNITVNNVDYKIVYPSIDVKYRAEELYVSILDSGKFATEYMNDQQVENILAHYNIWTKDMQDRLEFCQKSLDEYKMELFKQYSDQENRAKIKVELQTVKRMISELNEKKHSLDYLKLQYFATSTKNQYVISQRILDRDGSHVFPEDYNQLDITRLSKFLKAIEEKTVTAQDLRDIVKGDTWSNYTVQDNIFGVSSIDLNDDQRNLLALQKMYNNVRQHPECPSDEIINDDDALDGWFLVQKDKKKKEKVKNKLLDRVRGKVKDHSDIFIFTHNEEERKAIWDMNNIEGKRTIKSIEKTIQDKKEDRIQWQDIPIVRQQLIDEKTKGSKI